MSYISDKSSRQKGNKATEVLNNTLDQLKLVDICKILHLKKQNKTFFVVQWIRIHLSVQGT